MRKVILAGVLVLAAVVVVPLTVGSAPTAKVPSRSVGACGSDQTAFLNTYFAGRANGSTITLGHNQCYEIDTSVVIQSKTNLTINGNGSVFEQLAAPGSHQAILKLYEDTNLKITNLTVSGAYDGTNGGPSVEGDVGVRFEGDNGVLISNSTVENIQGDWIYTSPPYDLSDSDNLNTKVTLSNDTFDHAGYHGFTVESSGCWTLAPCNGLTIANSTMNDMGTDAMDFEVDTFSTPFNTDGTPFFFAEDWVTVQNNTWSNWAADWFSSDQGQDACTPMPTGCVASPSNPGGIQEQHLTITANKLLTGGPLFEVSGTNPATTTPAYLNAFWTIKNNSLRKGSYGQPYRGGTSVVAQFSAISQFTMMNNTFPLCRDRFEDPQPVNRCTSPPNEYALDLASITGGSITNNDFSGAEGAVQPQGFDTHVRGVTQCGNKYGTGGTSVDATC